MYDTNGTPTEATPATLWKPDELTPLSYSSNLREQADFSNVVNAA